VTAQALAGQVRHVAALVGDAVGQAVIEQLQVPEQVFGVQPVLLGWARDLERGQAGSGEGGRP
jgi:hypothetical protein